MKRAAEVDPRDELEPVGLAAGSPLPAPPCLFVDFTEEMLLATRPLHHLGVMANFQLFAASRFVVEILTSSASFRSASS
jgi:hypothetical protein